MTVGVCVYIYSRWLRVNGMEKWTHGRGSRRKITGRGGGKKRKKKERNCVYAGILIWFAVRETCPETVNSRECRGGGKLFPKNLSRIKSLGWQWRAQITYILIYNNIYALEKNKNNKYNYCVRVILLLSMA